VPIARFLGKDEASHFLRYRIEWTDARITPSFAKAISQKNGEALEIALVVLGRGLFGVKKYQRRIAARPIKEHRRVDLDRAAHCGQVCRVPSRNCSMACGNSVVSTMSQMSASAVAPCACEPASLSVRSRKACCTSMLQPDLATIVE
jgi:hypothetical protein